MTVTATPSLARIPAGQFLMGSHGAEDDERPVREVYIPEFFISRCPVTNDEYARFVHATGHPPPAIRTLPLVGAGEREEEFKSRAAPYEWDGNNPPHDRGEHPVVLVRFDDCVAYCRWLSEELGRVLRLPTEAEWEKAARGGVDSQLYPWGNEVDSARCNYLADGRSKAESGTRPVGSYSSNGYGLFDMVGNVWEWVADWYAPDYYANGSSHDPQGPPTGVMRIVRGGSWITRDLALLRTAHRHQVPDDTYAPSLGFRIACQK
jgi:formylglycine-generating enzyme